MTARLRLALRNEHGSARLTASLVEQLHAALESETGARIMTLENGGDAFCEGLDLGALLEADDATRALDRFAGLLRAIRTSPRPVIALVGGAAIGGGVGLVAAADFVIATPDATFGLPEALFGLVPAMVLPELARRIGVARAQWLGMGAAPISATEAWRIGLVDEVTDDLEATLARHARRLERMDPRALAAVKSLAAMLDPLSARYGAHAAERFQTLLASAETRTRIARFLDGETPWPEEEERA